MEEMTKLTADNKHQEMKDTVLQGGQEKYHAKNKEQGKLFVRERLELLFDEGLQAEDGTFANVLAGDLPADGVVTGIGKIHGRTVCVLSLIHI